MSMDNVTVTVKNKEYTISKGATLLELINKELPNAKKQIAAAISGDKIIELNTPVEDNIDIEWISLQSDEGLRILRHSASHIMALAVKNLYEDVKIAIGPATDDGFYYDFDCEHRFNEEDFHIIEEEMQKIIKKDIPFIKKSISKEDALKKFESENEKYKVELINELNDGEITTYTIDTFTDLCRGPHLPSTSYIEAFSIMRIAGAYWRGDEKREMLQRIYATAFSEKKGLKKYLNMLKEARERDHRKLGKEMNLFSFFPEGPGFPFWKPNGTLLYNTIVDYWRKLHVEKGYLEIKTPVVLNEDLWHQSGHWDHYKENMYFTEIDKKNFAIKPMNCPGGLLVYNDNIHSYRELPLKIAELGLVHRHEKSGVLHGLMRVRQFTQDDAHIYCRETQVKDEVKKVIALTEEIYNDFGFTNVSLELSTRPEKSIGDDEIWEIAEASLKEALEETGQEYTINEGDGAFYGPKIDFHIKDAIGRSWQCGTIQCDFSMPQRFDISYIGEDGQKHRPVMLHRAILGSLERFIGILIEHYNGKFPFWLSPEQIRILTVSENHNKYAEEIKKYLQNLNFRVNIDTSDEKLGTKIKQGRLDRVSHMMIIGDDELNNRTVTIRKADKNENNNVPFDKMVDFFNQLLIKRS